MKELLFLVITVVLFNNAYGFSCPKGKSLNSIASDLIRIELMGVHISGQESSKCLKQGNFKHFVVVYDPSNESFQGKTHTVNSIGDMTLTNVEEIDPDVYLHRANYEVKAKDLNGKEVILKDKIEFFLYKDLRNQKRYGCAGVTTAPTHKALLSSCEVN